MHACMYVHGICMCMQVTQQGLNIEHLQTEQHRRRRQSSPPIFTTHCHIASETPQDASGLRAELERLAAELKLSLKFEVNVVGTKDTGRLLHRTVTH